MNKIDYKSVIAQLAKVFPQCFHWEKPKPLKIGIFNDIRAAFEQTPEQWADMSLLQIRKMLYVYTHRYAYQKALATGGPRYDLQGQPAGAITAEEQQIAAANLKPRAESDSQRQTTAQRAPSGINPPTLEELISMATEARMEVTLKFNELPQAKPASPQTMIFALKAGQQTVVVEVRNKVWNKLKTATQQYPQWVASLTGQMGEAIAGGFRLQNPAVQVFEKKAKPENVETAASESASPAAPVRS